MEVAIFQAKTKYCFIAPSNHLTKYFLKIGPLAYHWTKN